MTTPPFRRRLPLASEVVADLSRRIAAGQWANGRALPAERELARQLGVSRPVLREALQRLQSLGLVEIRHGIGVRVVGKVHRPVRESVSFLLPDRATRLRQLIEVRLVVEPETARLAAARATQADRRRLAAVQTKLAATTDLAEAVELDAAFHHLLAAAARNAIFVLLLDSLAGLTRESREVTVKHYGAARSHEHHQDILDAVVAGDGARAAAAMRRHLELAAADLAAQLSSKARG